MAWTISELAWAAGFFEGEGCIQISKSIRRLKRATPHYSLGVEVSNTNPIPVAKFQQLFGGSVNERKGNSFRNRATIYRWNLSCGKASQFLRAILPYLTFKAEQAKLGIAFQETTAHTRRGIIIEAELVAYRESLRLQLRELLKTGNQRRLFPKFLPEKANTKQLKLREVRN